MAGYRREGNSLLILHITDRPRRREGRDDAHKSVCEVANAEVDGAAAGGAGDVELPAFEARGVLETDDSGDIEFAGLRKDGDGEGEEMQEQKRTNGGLGRHRGLIRLNDGARSLQEALAIGVGKKDSG